MDNEEDELEKFKLLKRKEVQRDYVRLGDTAFDETVIKTGALRPVYLADHGRMQMFVKSEVVDFVKSRMALRDAEPRQEVPAAEPPPTPSPAARREAQLAGIARAREARLAKLAAAREAKREHSSAAP